MQDQARPEITDELAELIRGMIARRTAVGDIVRLTGVDAYVVSVMVIESYNQECEGAKREASIESARRGAKMVACGDAAKRKARILNLHTRGVPTGEIAKRLGIPVHAVSRVLYKTKNKFR